MVPGIRPINIAVTSTCSPAFNMAIGVALATASEKGSVNVVIFPAKEISRKHLAARAGFIQFCPRPPYICFTMMMANTPPRHGIQTGIWGGMLSASIIPVTTALPS